MDIRHLTCSIEASWRINLFDSPLWYAVESGCFGKDDYASFLTQTYHYTRRSALIQSAAIPHFQINHRSFVESFLKHASEEEEHYRLALLDLKRLGFDPSVTENSHPAPLTEGYLGFIFNRITYVNPLSYLGYLYQLEYMAIRVGPVFAAHLQRSIDGVGNAMSFVKAHIHDDIDHIDALNRLVVQVSDSEVDELVYTATTSSALYSAMINDAFLKSRKDRGYEPNI